MMNILLIEPSFPYPNKSKNQAGEIHRNFVPVGLLKLGALYKEQGADVKLVRGNIEKSDIGFVPTKIFVTSIFTYWSKCVWETVAHYRLLFPRAEITIGGIYATLHHKRQYFKKKLTEYRSHCHVGLHEEAEKYNPDYSLLESDVDHHVTHAMRGCIRRCSFCGTWRIEPKRYDKPVEELVDEIKAVGKNKVIFFDNNFLAHGKIMEMLEGLANIRISGRPISYESQSGFDGRLLLKKPMYANLLKKAGFKNVRIAWDSSFAKHRSIKKQIDVLSNAGYCPKEIAIFMIYNYDTSYETMIRKLDKCSEWGVQINDCRYRPLNAKYDNYDPRKYKAGQTSEDYYIHTKGEWTDKKIRHFRRKVRRHNIWIRYAKDKGFKYDRNMERWSAIRNTFKYYGMGRPSRFALIEKSPTRLNRIRMMNKVKNYNTKKSLPSPDFSDLTKPEIDKKLNLILQEIS